MHGTRSEGSLFGFHLDFNCNPAKLDHDGLLMLRGNLKRRNAAEVVRQIGQRSINNELKGSNCNPAKLDHGSQFGLVDGRAFGVS